MARTRTVKRESDAERYRRFSVTEPRTEYAYVAFVGLDRLQAREVVHEIERGLPFAAFERLRNTLGLTAGEFAKVVAIPARTLIRRKSEGRLSLEESDRLVRVSRVFAHAVDVYDGDPERAAEWMKSPIPALGGRRPIDLVWSDAGAMGVDRILGRLEHGIFS